MGGMIAAVASVFITPWNLFNRPEVIHYTLDILGSFIGPLYGVLIVDFYVIKREQIDVDAMFTMSPAGRYWYDGGVNRTAVLALVPAACVAIACVIVPSLHALANFSWFIGVAVAAGIYRLLARRAALAPTVPAVASA
jgi:NCS1 family nucleobase:cation symporter-1